MKRLSKIVKKPWGAYYDLAEEKGKWHLKVIKVKKGQRLSLQKHKLRSEFWIVVEGKVRIQKNSKSLILKTGDTISFNRQEAHRLEGITKATIIEISFGQHEEKDIVRFEDDYGRAMQ